MTDTTATEAATEVYYTAEDNERNFLCEEIIKRAEFRTAAKEMTSAIEFKTSHSLCRDLGEIRARGVFFESVVSDEIRRKAIDEAQKQINAIVKGTIQEIDDDESLASWAGLLDAADDSLYTPGFGIPIMQNMTDDVAQSVARNGVANEISYRLRTRRDDVLARPETTLARSDLSARELTALNMAFVHAANAAVEICNQLSAPDEEKIIQFLEQPKLKAA